MPIFHDGWESESPEEKRKRDMEEQLRRKKSEEERLRMAESRRHEHTPPAARDLTLTTNDGRPLSRGEIIERIKRGESPTWTIRHGYGRNTSTLDKTSPKTMPSQSPPPSQLSSIELKETLPTPLSPEPLRDNYAAGMEIERPRSALHSGDFRSDKDKQGSHGDASGTPMATSPPAPWLFTGPRSYDERPPSRSRAAPHSLSQFILMPPTSPLVQALNNADLDYPALQRRKSRSPERDSRRHTFSPRSFQTFQSQCFGQPLASHRPEPAIRRGGTFPYQAHQPRRSVSSIGQLHPTSNPQPPLLRARGISQSSELSPLHHAPMVGSYEESILRGRMSTTPSRPLNFIAQIGVLGKGKCKPSLRCPPHVIVPFPAVFYSYSSGNGRISDNQPSPYVGLVDIENSLPPADETEDGRRRRRYSPNPAASDADDMNSANNSSSEPHARLMRKRRERLKKRSQSPKAPLGGSYRIPQQGQLQIVIKNPNKTAVKLFLVQYDLSDMEPGQKTFIRQRSYSAGPIIDMPMSLPKSLRNDRSEPALSSEDLSDRPILRYLIHLHICCTSKGRYYLYKSIRVVFANRVPDGKEKLRNEIQLPEPKYSTYKPVRDSQGAPATSANQASALGVALAAERAARRRSTPFNFAQQLHAQPIPQLSMDDVDGISDASNTSASAQYSLAWQVPSHARSPMPLPARVGRPIRPIPFTLSGTAAPPALTSPADMVARQMELDGPRGAGAMDHLGGASNVLYLGQQEPTKMDANTAFIQGYQSPNLVSPRHPLEGLLARRLKGYGDGISGGADSNDAV